MLVVVAPILVFQRFTRTCRSLQSRAGSASRPHGSARGHTRTALVWACALVLLLLLTSCSDTPPAQQAHSTPTTTPGTATSTPTPAPTASGDWPTYHANAERTGYVADTPDPRHLTSLWKKSLDGAVYAEPLVVGGQVIVATEHDTLYALDARTGQVQWQTNVGKPVPLSSLPCGNIDPLGITGTPVYDPQTGLVFAVAEIQGPAHLLVGLDVNSGQVKVRRMVDVPGQDPRVHQQRAALALYQGMVYIAYGGLDGDCGDYHGKIVAARTDGTGDLLVYQVPTPREGGIWTTPGPVIDAEGNIYIAVGNGAATSGNWDHSDSILRLSPTLQLEDGFAPTSWASDNARDADLGSMGPVLLPNGLIYTQGKARVGYLLNADQLGGVGGQIQSLSACKAYGGAAVSGQSFFVPCTDGLRQFTVTTGPKVVIGWHSAVQITGSPIIGGQTIYSLSPGTGVLYALNVATGKVRAQISVGTAARFNTPTLWEHTVFVGTMKGIVAVSIA